MSFVKVEKVLQKVAANSGDPDAMEAELVIHKINLAIPQFFTKNILNNILIKYYQKGTVTIFVNSSACAHEVKMLERKLINFLTTEIPEVEFLKIKIRIDSTIH